MTLNPYVKNDSINYDDPSGMFLLEKNYPSPSKSQAETARYNSNPKAPYSQAARDEYRYANNYYNAQKAGAPFAPEYSGGPQYGGSTYNKDYAAQSAARQAAAKKQGEDAKKQGSASNTSITVAVAAIVVVFVVIGGVVSAIVSIENGKRTVTYLTPSGSSSSKSSTIGDGVAEKVRQIVGLIKVGITVHWSMVKEVIDEVTSKVAQDTAEGTSGSKSKDDEIKTGDKTPDGHSFSEHGAERANERGFTKEAIDSIINNNKKKRKSKVDAQGRKTWEYTDKRGNKVVTNESGGIVSVHSPAPGGKYIPKK